MKSIIAFVDESGNSSLDTSKGGTSKYFIVCAILTDQSSIEELRRDVGEVRKMYFQNGEMKSSSIKDKDGHKRRIAIINRIKSLDFHFYALAVDKKLVIRDGGLQYKRPFIKFVNGLIMRHLFSSYSDIQVIADEQGGKEFQESLKQYLLTRHRADLFWTSSFKTVPSESEDIVQLADFIGGTLAKAYEKKGNPALQEAVLALVSDKSVGITQWPTRFNFYFATDRTTAEYDEFIHSHALAKAESFIELHRKESDEDTNVQVAALSYLVFQSRLSQVDNYISTPRILDHMSSIGFNLTEHAVRSTVIAKLRDKGVIVASCSKGYKIPRCYADLFDFVDRVNGQVVPLLERLNKARNSYLLASRNDIDLLKGPNYPHLVAFLEHLQKHATSIRLN